MLAAQNYSVQGMSLLASHEYQVDETIPIIGDLIAMGGLVARAPDGTYPPTSMRPAAIRCCGS